MSREIDTNEEIHDEIKKKRTIESIKLVHKHKRKSPFGERLLKIRVVAWKRNLYIYIYRLYRVK